VEWLWVVLLFVIILGPIVVLRIRRGRGETLRQAPDSLMESYRHRFEQGPRWPRG
jgi:hypothetical protein